uniref:Uncharacterized protein n=1 Tax=Micrurus corallinus TaxID=54390 RepID=A0A2D4FX68_MICCO
MLIYKSPASYLTQQSHCPIRLPFFLNVFLKIIFGMKRNTASLNAYFLILTFYTTGTDGICTKLHQGKPGILLEVPALYIFAIYPVRNSEILGKKCYYYVNMHT